MKQDHASLCAIAILALPFTCPAASRSQPPASPRRSAPTTAPAHDADRLYKSAPGPYRVTTLDEDWHDADRQRDVPVRVYLPNQRDAPGKDRGRGEDEAPRTARAKHPVIIFSHGLGGSRFNYGYFCGHLAGHGYIVIAPTHAGSDTRSLIGWGGKSRRDDSRPDHQRDTQGRFGRGWLAESISDADNLRNRPQDVSFIIDQLDKHRTLRRVADPARVGVAGHSFGAYTAMAVAGMTVDLPNDKTHSFRDARVRAVLPMSPQGANTMGVATRSWDRVAVPVLFLTGTRDYGIGARSAAWRRQAFDAIRGVDAYLVVLNDATHMTFAGPGGGLARLLRGANSGPPNARHLDMIRSLGTAFFDAYLVNDATAKRWLRRFAAARHDDCTAEHKPAKRSAGE